MERLETTAEVMDALGGNKAVAQMTGRKYNAAANWRAFPKFPSNTFLVMRGELHKLGKTAPASLWGMAEVEQVA